MRPFSQWVADMANSIEDASTIVKDEHGNVLPNTPKPKTVIYDDMYEKWSDRMDDPYYEGDYE